MYLSLYLSIYVCMHVCVYACMRVCMYACMYACMHHVSMMIVCLVGHMRLPWVDGRWQPEPAGRKRAKRGESSRVASGRAEHVGGAVRVFKMWWAQMSACLFALNLVFFLWHSQGRGGREGDSLGEWWVGAVGREMGTVALGWVAGPVHAAAQSKQASKESRVEMWHFCCWILGVSWWPWIRGSVLFPPLQSLVLFLVFGLGSPGFFQGKVVLGTPVLKPPLFRIILKWYWNRPNFCELFDLEWNRYKKNKNDFTISW